LRPKAEHQSTLQQVLNGVAQRTKTKVFDKIRNLVPQFAPTCAMADFEEASVSAFQKVFGNITVSGCWFHYAQALMKCVNKESLKEDYTRDEDVGSVVHCLTSLPLLPPREIADALSDIQAQLAADSQHASWLQKLIANVNRQWITKRSIGPERLSVRDNRSQTKNVRQCPAISVNPNFRPKWLNCTSCHIKYRMPVKD